MLTFNLFFPFSVPIVIGELSLDHVSSASLLGTPSYPTVQWHPAARCRMSIPSRGLSPHHLPEKFLVASIVVRMAPCNRKDGPEKRSR